MRWVAVLLLTAVMGCATAREYTALRQVQFRYDGVSSPRIAGVPLTRARSFQDLSATDLARLGIAIATKDVPFDITVHILGRNPETNNVTARMVALDWTYLVDGRETVSGHLGEPLAFRPGEPRDVPLFVTFNLMDAFGAERRDLVEIALALAGQRRSTHQVSIRLWPRIDTRVGEIRYAAPITLDLAAPSQ
jgi:hypothetical protein